MRVSRTTGAGSGLILVLLGLWVGLVPFFGPYFDYGFMPNATWHFSLDRLWLNILPGVAILLGGLFLMGAARRSGGAMGAALAVAGGVWLLIGPSVSMFWEHPAPGMLISGIGAPIGGHDRAAIEMIGFFYGAGALALLLSALALGRFAVRGARVADPAFANRRFGVRERGNTEPDPGYAEPISVRRTPASQPAERPAEPAQQPMEPGRPREPVERA